MSKTSKNWTKQHKTMNITMNKNPLKKKKKKKILNIKKKKRYIYIIIIINN